MQNQVEALYGNFHQISLDYLHDIHKTKSLSSGLLEKLLNYWELRLSDQRDPLYYYYFEYYLFFESINSGIVCSFIFNEQNNRIMHQYGVLTSSIPDIIKRLKEQIQNDSSAQPDLEYKTSDDTLSLWFKRIRFRDGNFILAALFPANVNIHARLTRMEKVFVRFYLPDSLHPENRFHDFFSRINEQIVPQISPFLEEGKPVTFTYFKFERFQKFVTIGGESFAAELITGLAYELTSHLKKSDRCYVLNPREYLIISTNCEKEIMQKRFHRMIFQVKSLILNYKVRYTTWRIPIEDVALHWKDIVVE